MTIEGQVVTCQNEKYQALKFAAFRQLWAQHDFEDKCCGFKGSYYYCELTATSAGLSNSGPQKYLMAESI